MTLDFKMKKIEKLIIEGTKLLDGFTDDNLGQWKKNVIHTVEKNFGATSSELEKISKVRFSPIAFNSRTNFTPYKIRGIKDTLVYLDLFLNDFKDELEALESSKTENRSLCTENDLKVSNNKVFIIHGHDGELKSEVARFLEKLGLEAIILHEQVNGGKTIIEKLVEHTDVGYGIALYTPCDIGGKDEMSLKPRARQNVIFEHGMLVGRLGRGKVTTLVKGEVELPNDISGTVYTPADSGWQFKLARELKGSGYEIDLNVLLG